LPLFTPPSPISHLPAPLIAAIAFHASRPSGRLSRLLASPICRRLRLSSRRHLLLSCPSRASRPAG
jgi:hypothetical protein